MGVLSSGFWRQTHYLIYSVFAFSLWLTLGTRAPLASAPPEDIRCGVCQKTFKRKDFLRQHMRMHAPERDVCRCPRAGCGRTYTTAFNLQSHILSFHEQQRPFVCEHAGCGKTFAMKVSPAQLPASGTRTALGSASFLPGSWEMQGPEGRGLAHHSGSSGSGSPPS